MEEEVEQAEHIPDFLNAEAFIAARLNELTALNNAIGESNKVTSIFQRLPKHMRRRAMSHTVKRLPRNLRDAHKRQLEKNNALKKSKKARKRFRKRSKQLLLEYNRRQNKNMWLETHIWHAKRFRMFSKWNYKIAESSYEKTFRASYRASKSHCLIQDISYYCCIELNGPLELLYRSLKTITNSACGLSFTAKCWLSGNREGKVTLFHANSYPHKVIGDVTFMWKPDSSSTRTLWLWCHPAFYQEVLDELISIFQLNSIPMTEDVEMKNDAENTSSSKKKKRKCNVELAKMSLKNVPVSRVPKFVNSENTVTVLLLKDTLNRFRLTGPLSNAVIAKALHPADLFDDVLLQSNKDNWWLEYRRQQKSGTCTASHLLEQYCSPSLFPPHVILGANIVDPRLFLKRRKTKVVPENQEYEYCLSVPATLSNSFIWRAEIRDVVSTQKWPSGKLNKLRSDLLVPGFDHQLLKKVNTVIPVLFVQRPGTDEDDVKLNYGCGWDIILPANWAMPVWLSLILCGARAGGFRETCTINFESQRIPELFPDSKAGIAHFAAIRKVEEDRYFRKPPNKRTNFLKHGFPSPFYHPWDLIVKEWSPDIPGQYFVLRNKTILRELKEYIDNLKSNRRSPRHFSLPAGSLIPVSLTMLSNGQLAPFSHICLPTETDLKLRAQDRLYSGPCEKMHRDETKQDRKALRAKHTKELKRLRRKRIKAKKERIENGLPLKITKRRCSPTETEVAAYLNAVRQLWIRPQVTEIRSHCAREIFGFVVLSGFSFVQSCTSGQGYVVAEALEVLLELREKMLCELVVLTRSFRSLSYRFCRINVIV